MKKLNLALMLCLSCLFSSSLYAAYDGGSGIDEAPYQIRTAEQMNEIGLHPEDWNSYFVLVNDIDMSAYTGSAYNIIGNATTPFTGNFNGDGHVIKNFTSTTNGLFGHTSNAQIKNLGLENTDVTLGSSLVGIQDGGVISNCYSTGIVSGGYDIGGLVGRVQNDGLITDCHTSGSVEGTWEAAGGLAGRLFSGTISNCYSTANVAGKQFVGGLVGRQDGSIISKSYSSGSVSGDYAIGGLVGEMSMYDENDEKIISECYATGDVSGEDEVGGLVGTATIGVAIQNCYSTGHVTAEGQWQGGLVGNNNFVDVINSFWDTETSDQTASAGGEGKTTAEMQTLSTFTDAGWDFSDSDGDAADWLMPAVSYPRLAWEKFITFSPDEGTYLSKQNVTVTCSSPTATIHYTVNGNVPTESDPVIVSGSSVLISKSMTLKARAWEEGSNPSEIKSANYQIDLICPTADLNGDCKVDLKDFAILSQWWLEVCNPLNQWCAGTDLDLSGVIDLGELEDVVSETLEGENIADHVKYIAVDMEWDYQKTDNPDVSYNFQVSVDTDETVALVSFTIPTGQTLVIPAMDKVWDIPEPNGLLTIGVESYIPGEYNWEYRYKFNSPEPLSTYGDGLYTITIYYTDGATQQTTVWFGIPGTTNPLPQPTQEPVFTSIHNGGTVSSPVTFAWEACTDPAVGYIFFMTISSQTGLPGNFYTLSPQAMGLYTPIAMTPGGYSVFLTFISGDDGWGLINDDGIPYSAYKSCGNWGCVITVE